MRSDLCIELSRTKAIVNRRCLRRCVERRRERATLARLRIDALAVIARIVTFISIATDATRAPSAVAHRCSPGT